MSIDRFVYNADEAFDPDRPLSAATLRRMGKDLIYLFNHRLPGDQVGYLQGYGQSTVRLPRLHSARWVKFGPFPFYVPPQIGMYGAPKEITIRLHGSVDNHSVNVVALCDDEAPDADTLQGLADAGTYGDVLTTSDTTAQLQVRVTPGRENDLWIAFRSEGQETAGSMTTLTATPTIDLYRPRHALTLELAAASVPLSGVTADTIPELYVVRADAAAAAVSAPWDERYTVAYYDDDGSTNGRLYIAEHRAFRDRLRPLEVSNTYFVGSLGVLELASIAVSCKQSIDLDDARGFPPLRPDQPLTATAHRELLRQIDLVNDARLPRIGMGQAQANPGTAADYPGAWRLDGYAAWTQSTAGKGDPYGSATIVYRTPYLNVQDFRSTDRPEFRVTVPMHFMGTIDTQVRLVARLVDMSGSVLASETVDVTRPGIVPSSTSFTEPWGLTQGEAWLLNTANQRGVGLEAYTAASLPESKWSHDGLCPIGEDLFSNVLLAVPFYGLLTSEQLARVEVTAERLTSYATNEWGVIAFHNIGGRVAAGPDAP